MTDSYDAPGELTPSDPVAGVLARGLGTLHEKMGIELIDIGLDRVVATMPVAGNTQPMGLLHGGASVVLAESIGSVGALVHGYPDRVAVGVDINATHHRSVGAGIVTGVGTQIHVGRTSTTWSITITDDQERLLCTARITCAFVTPRN
jgi:1,4-dihydroxy-2-naphthoyl-CoA hydrolase